MMNYAPRPDEIEATGLEWKILRVALQYLRAKTPQSETAGRCLNSGRTEINCGYLSSGRGHGLRMQAHATTYLQHSGSGQLWDRLHAIERMLRVSKQWTCVH